MVLMGSPGEGSNPRGSSEDHAIHSYILCRCNDARDLEMLLEPSEAINYQALKTCVVPTKY
jgi:hypothetical protein